MNEIEEELFTLREAAYLLGVTLVQVKYAVASRPVPRRLAGTTTLVKLADLRRALADVDQRYNWRASRANVKTVSN